MHANTGDSACNIPLYSFKIFFHLLVRNSDEEIKVLVSDEDVTPVAERNLKTMCAAYRLYNKYLSDFRSIFNVEHKAQFGSYHDDLAFLSHSYTRIPEARVYCNSVLRNKQWKKGIILFSSKHVMSQSNSMWHSPVVVRPQAVYTECEGQKAQTWKWHLQQTFPDLWPVSETHKALISRLFITVLMSLMLYFAPHLLFGTSDGWQITRNSFAFAHQGNPTP